MLDRSFYVREGALFVPTQLTRGPWSNDHQHGGPPSALVGRAMESFGHDAATFTLVRVTIELLRPVPMTPLEVSVRFVTEGKTAQRLEATVSSGGVEILRALGLRLKKREVPIPDGVHTPPPAAPGPSELRPFSFPFFRHEIAYHRALDLRFARGQWGDRDVVVWARPTVPLVEGEPLSPLQHVLVIVDAESGICPPLPPTDLTFLNPDLTLYCERPLAGDWLGLAIRSSASPIGTGLAESSLFDAQGVFGRSAQSLALAPRKA